MLTYHESVVEKYKELFNSDKGFLDILQECHDQMRSFEKATLSLIDFRDDTKHSERITLINEYRKYCKLEDVILQAENSIIPADFHQSVSYHDIVEAKKFYDEHFEGYKFFVKRNQQESTNLYVKKCLTVNDIFDNLSGGTTNVYYLESNKQCYIGLKKERIEFIFRLPFLPLDFDNLSQNTLLFAYIYLVKQWLESNFNSIDLSKEYTTIYREYGFTYQQFIEEPKNGYETVYLKTVLPFLIEPQGLKYIPRLNVIKSNWGLMPDKDEDNEAQIDSFSSYFAKVKIDYSKIQDYLKTSWIRKFDIGKIYTNVDYNFVGTKAEVEEYRQNIIAEKEFDIKRNIVLYKKWGQFKYGFLKNSLFPKPAVVFKDYILEYLETVKTDKKDFETVRDNRLNLDSSIFRLAESNKTITRHSFETLTLGQSFKRYANHHFVESNVFEVSTGIEILVDLVGFIQTYNQIKQAENLQIQPEWYWHYDLLNNYVIGNGIQSFSQEPMRMSCRPEEFETLFNNFYFDDNDVLQERHPQFKPKYEKYLISPLSQSFYVIPACLSIYLPERDLDKLRKGTHNLFKSPFFEEQERKKQSKLLSSQRLLSKAEIEEKHDVELIYTGSSDEEGKVFKGMKGVIVGFARGYVIKDELGNTHRIAYSQIKNSLWVNTSTVNQRDFFNSLTLKEKAFLQNRNQLLLP